MVPVTLPVSPHNGVSARSNQLSNCALATVWVPMFCTTTVKVPWAPTVPDDGLTADVLHEHGQRRLCAGSTPGRAYGESCDRQIRSGYQVGNGGRVVGLVALCQPAWRIYKCPCGAQPDVGTESDRITGRKG